MRNFKEKDRDRDIRDRDRDLRDRDRERGKDRDRRRSRSPDRTRSRHARSRTRSPDLHLKSRSRSRSLDRRLKSHSRSPDRSRRHYNRSPSPDPYRKHRRREEDDKDRHRTAVAVSEFVDSIAKEQQKKHASDPPDAAVDADVDPDELEMMKTMGIPVGFDSTKGKPVPGANVSGVRAVTKRQPRQYMNRRGGFNRPLPLERNR
ncbi:U4/U6.U5 small nuclear ribonucleoprotein [Tasmannia lanceolata]|uniref:U4/U6.U5 small nuclear ribonucleoprotein n=1 Tax=Tasmannia lanceolata TaxID=3420 RepID=UPI004063CFF9